MNEFLSNDLSVFKLLIIFIFLVFDFLLLGILSNNTGNISLCFFLAKFLFMRRVLKIPLSVVLIFDNEFSILLLNDDFLSLIIIEGNDESIYNKLFFRTVFSLVLDKLLFFLLKIALYVYGFFLLVVLISSSFKLLILSLS